MKAVFALANLCSRIYGFLQVIPVVGRFTDILSSSVCLVLRGSSGSWVAAGIEKCKRPQKLLILYDFEACPYCRKVREALSALDLDAEIRPCPKESLRASGIKGKSRYRGEVTKLGFEMMFPVLVDENTGVKLNQSEKIVEYLWKTYGSGATPDLGYKLGRKLDATPVMMLPMFFRPMLSHGMLRYPSKAAQEPLELWSFESSPFCRLVREALCVLELRHVVRNVAHGSEAKRLAFRERYGARISSARKATFATTIKVPFLRDPNTGAEMFESADIVRYLFATYQDGPAPIETWADFEMPKHLTNAAKKD